MTANIALDTVTNWDETYVSDEQSLNELVAGTNVTWEIEDPHGPGGGWPVVRYTAPTQEELDAFVLEHFGEE